MSAITGNIQTFFQSYSTGHPLLDTLILTTMVPMLITYVSGLMTFLKTIGEYIFNFIKDYLKFWLKSKTLGNSLCNVNITEHNELYNLLYSIIFDDSVISDPMLESRFLYLSTFVERSNSKFDREYRYFGSYNEYDARLNYNGESLLTVQKKHGFIDSKKKIFKHENDFVRFTLKEEMKKESYQNSSRMIEIELLTFRPVKKSTDQHVGIKEIEKFLKNRFNIDKKIYFVYHIRCNNTFLENHIRSIIQKNYSNSQSGLLRFSSLDISLLGLKDVNPENHFLERNLEIELKNNDFSKVEKDYTHDVQLRGCDNETIIDPLSLTFQNLYKKYVNPKIDQNLMFIGTCGFFIKDNKLYFIRCNGMDVTTINIVSFGSRMNETDVKKDIDYLIKLGMSNKSTSTDKSEVYIFRRVNNGWNSFRLDQRSFDTIYLPTSLMTDIKSEINKFIELEKLYRSYQIPYKKGILFYGPPGTGKTSLVKALAFEYQLHIYTINVNDDDINDESIVDILNSLGSNDNKILLFEDIDTAFSEKEIIKHENKVLAEYQKPAKNQQLDSKSDDKKDINEIRDLIKNNQVTKKFLTYSGLLNALDGVLSNQNGVITIMTTNHIEKLGEAFLRPGRIDRKFELKECNAEQIEQMITRFIEKRKLIDIENHSTPSYPENEFKKKIREFNQKVCDSNGQSKIKPCGLQFYILKYIESIDSIFDNYQELLQ